MTRVRQLRFEGLPHTRARGVAAEAAAAAYLEREGFAIVARNVRTKAGEIDLVAREGDTLCFVEIKARTRSEFAELWAQ